MGPRSRSSVTLVVLLGLILGGLGQVHARVDLVEGETVRLSVDGYVMSLGGVQVSSVNDALALGLPQHTGLQSTVARANLKLAFGDSVVIEGAQVLSYVLTSEPTDQSSPMGLGVSPPPSRWLDLRAPIVETSTATLAADVDRLVIRIFAGPVDLSVGRQAVTWGRSMMFKPTDIFTSLSALDLDQTQKRGVDAVRASTSVGGVELDAVVVHRGELDQLSGGARATFYLDVMDVWTGFARNWDQVMFLGGISGELGSFKLRGEGSVPWDEETEGVELPRVTLGVDYFHPRWIVAMELHHNGSGADKPSQYLAHALTSRHLARGEVLNTGRWYGGGLVSFSPIDTVHFSVTTMANLQEPSAVFAVSAQLDLPHSTQLGLGTFTSVGARPSFSPVMDLGSEFGAYGHLVFLQLSTFM